MSEDNEYYAYDSHSHMFHLFKTYLNKECSSLEFQHYEKTPMVV